MQEVQEKKKTFESVYLHRDTFGRLFLDKCSTEEQHLLTTFVADGDDRPRCRTYFDSSKVFGEFVGKKGTFEITVRYIPEG